MDDKLLKLLALGALAPGLFAAIFFAAVWFRKPAGVSGASAPWVRALIPLALAAAYAVMHRVLFGSLNLPPRSADDWLPVAAFIAAAALLPLALRPVDPSAKASSLRMVAIYAPIVIGAGLLGYLLLGKLTDRMSGGAIAAHAGLFALAASLAAVSIERVARTSPAALTGFIAMTVAGGASQVLVLAFNSLKLSQSAGVWAALMGGAMVVGLTFRGRSLAFAGAVLPVMMALAAVYSGVLFTDTDNALVYAGLLAASPVLAALGSVGPMVKLQGWKSWALKATLAGLPVAGALAMAGYAAYKASQEAAY